MRLRQFRADRFLLNALLCAFVCSPAMADPAPPAPSNGNMGLGDDQIHLHAGHIVKSANQLLVTNGFTGKSDTYSLAAQTLTADLIPGAAGAAAVKDALLTGDPENGKQVFATIKSTPVTKPDPSAKSVPQGYLTKIWSDTLTYQATPEQKSLGVFTFSGHVLVITDDSALLAVPGNTTFDHLKVYVGPAPDYPQIDGENVDATFVPAPKPGAPAHGAGE